MESNIKKLSIREIISKVGFPITINEFRNTYKFNVDLQLAMEFEEQLKQINRMSEIEKIIFRYENIFDKEIYVFHLARLLEKDIENLKRAELLGQNNIEQLVFTNDITGKNKRRFFVNAKNLLKKCDVIDIVMKKKSKGEIEIYSSIDFIEENTEFSDAMEAESIEKFDLIEQKIGFENVLKYIEDTDLQDICRYSNLAMLLMVESEKLENKIKKYLQYIDLDKMLVLANAIYFYKYGENFYNFSKEEAYELKDFTEKVSEVVKDRVKFLQSSRFYFTIDYAEIKEKIKKLLEHVENVVLIEHNESIIEKEAEELTKEIIENEMPVEEIIYSEKEIIDQDDIFKTEIIKEENSNNISFESEEKVIGDIFELAKLEETIEEKNSEPVIEKTEILEKETKEVFVNESEEEFETENIEVEEAEIQETEMQETEMQETEIQETKMQETEMQETEIQETEIQEVEVQEKIEKVEENIEDATKSITEEKQEETNKFIDNFANDETRIIMNFENRKHTIFKLDENYSQENLEDGTTIFLLPTKECYIIESSFGKGNFAGNATYIVNKDLFEKQRNSLIENNSLKQKKLSMLKSNNQKDVTKLVYTGWENAITTFFNMKTEEKYTQEEKENINRIIGKING